MSKSRRKLFRFFSFFSFFCFFRHLLEPEGLQDPHPRIHLLRYRHPIGPKVLSLPRRLVPALAMPFADGRRLVCQRGQLASKGVPSPSAKMVSAETCSSSSSTSNVNRGSDISTSNPTSRYVNLHGRQPDNPISCATLTERERDRPDRPDRQKGMLL